VATFVILCFAVTQAESINEVRASQFCVILNFVDAAGGRATRLTHRKNEGLLSSEPFSLSAK
jgi:hypothetical protein